MCAGRRAVTGATTFACVTRPVGPTREPSAPDVRRRRSQPMSRRADVGAPGWTHAEPRRPYERLPAGGSTRTPVSVHPPGPGTTRRSEPTSSRPLGTGRSGRSPLPTSNAASTTGRSVLDPGRCGGCTRPSQRSSTPRCSTIGSPGHRVGESDCRPSNPSTDPSSPRSNWRSSQRRCDQS
jgi:hypothetical protein